MGGSSGLMEHRHLMGLYMCVRSVGRLLQVIGHGSLINVWQVDIMGQLGSMSPRLAWWWCFKKPSVHTFQALPISHLFTFTRVSPMVSQTSGAVTWPALQEGWRIEAIYNLSQASTIKWCAGEFNERKNTNGETQLWHTVYPGLPHPWYFTSCSLRTADTFSTEPTCQDDDGIN